MTKRSKYWLSKEELEDMNVETKGDVKARRKDRKEYNFGVPKKTIERFRKQARENRREVL